MTLPRFFDGTGMPNAGWWEALWPHPNAVLDRSELGRGLDVLGLCSGDGWFTQTIARRSKHVYSVDIDPAFIALAETRFGEAGIGNRTFIAGDAYLIAQLVPKKVDFAVLANAYHGVPDQPRLCRAVRDLLKPGGKFAIVNCYPRPREETKVLGEPRGPKTELRMSTEATIESTVDSGLSVLKLDDVSPYHYTAIFERKN